MAEKSRLRLQRDTREWRCGHTIRHVEVLLGSAACNLRPQSLVLVAVLSSPPNVLAVQVAVFMARWNRPVNPVLRPRGLRPLRYVSLAFNLPWRWEAVTRRKRKTYTIFFQGHERCQCRWWDWPEAVTFLASAHFSASLTLRVPEIYLGA